MYVLIASTILKSNKEDRFEVMMWCFIQWRVANGGPKQGQNRVAVSVVLFPLILL